MAMGMLQDQKKLAQVIVGKMKPDGTEQVEKGPEVDNDTDVAMETVATKIMSAIQKNDKKAFIEGMKDFMSIIQIEDHVQDSAAPMEG